MRRKVIQFQWHSAIISRHIEAAALSSCAGINGSLSKRVTGNKFGALPLTIRS